MVEPMFTHNFDSPVKVDSVIELTGPEAKHAVSVRRMRVGEAIIDLLVREYELDTVFGIPGVHNIELFRGLHSSGVLVVAPLHEQGE